jgi:hypothetical protein
VRLLCALATLAPTDGRRVALGRELSLLTPQVDARWLHRLGAPTPRGGRTIVTAPSEIRSLLLAPEAVLLATSKEVIAHGLDGIPLFRHGGATNSPSLSRDGRRAAWPVSTEALVACDLVPGAQPAALRDELLVTYQRDFARIGHRLYSSDGQTRISVGNAHLELEHRRGATVDVEVIPACLSLHPGEENLVTAGMGNLAFVELPYGRVRAIVPTMIEPWIAHADPDTLLLLDEGGRFYHLDAATLQERWAGRAPLPPEPGAIALSPDRRLLAVGSATGIHVLHAATGEPVAAYPLVLKPSAVAVANDGAVAVACRTRAILF